MPLLSEDALEKLAGTWFEETGWQVTHGPDVAPDTPDALRASFRQTSLAGRLVAALRRLNPTLPEAVVQEVAERVVRAQHPNATESNRLLHGWLTDGVPVDVPSPSGELRGDRAWLVDFDDVERNDWLVISQFTVVAERRNRRPDLVAFLNGLPVAVIELKKPQHADVWDAYEQLQTYRQELPDLFLANVALVVSDGKHARVGALTADRERFMPWRTILAERDQRNLEFELETVVRGFFKPDLFLDYLRHFVLYEPGAEGQLIKKIAAYHQFHAVRTAVAATILAARQPDTILPIVHDEPAPYAGRLPGREAIEPGSRKGGIVWHTQGSGKSISMACFAGKLRQQPEMRNPTLVIVTDRNDLDDQLFQQFAHAKDVLKEMPVQVATREQLRALLDARPSGGIFFTTIQKFSPLLGETTFPQLSDRTNIVVIADEAHRSQYGLSSKLDRKSGKYKTGFAKHLRDALPLATFVGFTGTPLETDDVDTRQVFGPYVSIYDIEDAVRDKATVPIYYASRLPDIEKIKDEEEIVEINEEAEEIVSTDAADIARREAEKQYATRREQVFGTPARIDQIAADIVTHFEQRSADGNIEGGGKAMIVGMSREICARLYTAIVQLRPEWHSDDPKLGAIKVVITGSAADKEPVRSHLYAPGVRKTFEKRFKNPKDPLRLVIVRDMWLTGFDVLSLHTMYIDKPMQAHNLMQAIARVNRVFKNKSGGLVVDYIGIATELKRALKTYTSEGGKTSSGATGSDKLTIDLDRALTELQEAVGDVRHLLRKAEYRNTYLDESLQRLREVSNHVLELPDDERKKFFDKVLAAGKAFALCSTLPEAQELRDELAFYQGVRGFISESSTPESKLDRDQSRYLLKQLLDRAVQPVGMQDIFTLAGVDSPDVSILSDNFLAEMRDLPQRNLAIELLQKLLHDQIHSRTRTNIVQQQLFTERLDKTLENYRNRVIQSALQLSDLVDSLVLLAQELRDADKRGESLGLNPAELAFYDALHDNGSANEILGGDETLRRIAAELLDKIKRNTGIDWQKRESVRARLRNLVRITLRRYQYPPDKQEKAIDLVLEQAERMADVLSMGEDAL